MVFTSYVPSELGKEVVQKIPSAIIYCLAYWSVARMYPCGTCIGQSKKREKKSSKLPIIYRLLILCMVVYHMTADYAWAYIIFGFHLMAFVVYVTLLGCICLALWSKSRNPFHMTVPLSLLAFFLLERSKSDQLLLWLLNYQLHYVLRPFIQRLREKYPQGSQHNELIEQLCFVLLMIQTCFIFTVGMQNNFDLNVDPFTGRVGLKNFDMYPILSAVFMWYAKYSIWMIFTYSSWCTYSTGQRTYFIPIGALLMNYAVLNVVFHEMMWRYMMPARFTEILINTVSLGLLAAIYILVDLVKTKKVVNSEVSIIRDSLLPLACWNNNKENTI